MRTSALLLFAWLPLLGCASTPRPADTAEARAAFSRDAYCPLERVTASPVVAIPTPSPAIARDAERLAMWRAAAEAQARSDPKKLVAVSGCGENLVYSCWEVGGSVPTHRGTRWETIGVVCQGNSW